MRNKIHKVYNKVGIKTERTKNITKHVIVSFLYKGGSIISSFLLVPLTINFLDAENYGIWLTLSSFIAWFSFFDIGLGNGLRNKFAEAKAKGDLIAAKAYVSSAYYTIGAVCVALILLFITLNFFIDWSRVLNTNPLLEKKLAILMPIVFSFFCLQLVAKLITTIYTADQHHSMQGKVSFFTSAGSLLAIWIMTETAESSLLHFGIIFSALPGLLLVGINLFAFSTTYKDYRPSYKFWKKKYLKDIFGLGFMFFLVQISGIILYSTDNMIISNLFSPADVVPFNIAYKYFSIASMVFAIIASPYWSSITEAYTKNDFEWIKNSMKNFNKIAMVFIVLILIMILFSNVIYDLWVGSKVHVNYLLSLLIGVFIMASIFVTPYTIFLNGIGKVKIQALQSIICCLINIPLSIYFARNLEMGTSGIIFATIVCFIPSVILAPLQYFKIINNTATGLWIK
ncbi:MATE family efflux transporter [Flavobacterium sp. KACC 22761]|uniref:lipopolysaccharide biosynthesis protein n=1 Tax=Flavobacterium sp. KACC 22761 TaxID=3092665 RepID=UPI002A75F961|nr:MATE family efflux transporter [Flavobacterium sp. KACC 22761]WPO79094.1 MATE family efflux transporter [Flavobacterium sp. KACC 22761]